MTDKSIVFTALNRHSADSGKPPRITREIGNYYGYFEAEFGDQFVFVYDKETGEGQLWCGDYSWEEPVTVIDGKASELELSGPEVKWLQLVWEVAAGIAT